MTTTRTVPAHFTADLARLDAGLTARSAIRELEDGFRYIDEDAAGPDLVRLASSLYQIGYANGWM